MAAKENEDGCWTEYVEVRDAGRMGVGVFATQHIPSNVRIVSEKPIFTLLSKSLNATTAESDILKAYSRLSASEKQRFDALRAVTDFPNRQDPFMGMPAAEVGLTEEDFMVLRKFLPNTNANDDWTGVYDLMCRFNHACQPNAEKRFTKGTAVECWTTTEIQEGEEITVCYHNDGFFMTTEERRTAFLLHYPWRCECKLCLKPAHERLASDMRRFLMRRLYIAIWGHDLKTVHKQLSVEERVLVAATKRAIGVYEDVEVAALDVSAIRNAMHRQTSNWGAEERIIIFNWLLATLADVEGAVIGGEVALYYAQATAFLLEMALDDGHHVLPLAVRANVSAWTRKNKELAPLEVGAETQVKDKMWKAWQFPIDAVGPNGELHGVVAGLQKMAAFQ